MRSELSVDYRGCCEEKVKRTGKMKILHMTPPEVRNGVYQYIFNHMPFIDLSKYEFSFLTKVADELKETKEKENSNATRLPFYDLICMRQSRR